jgi:hypothetical protein
MDHSLQHDRLGSCQERGGNRHETIAQVVGVSRAVAVICGRCVARPTDYGLRHRGVHTLLASKALGSSRSTRARMGASLRAVWASEAVQLIGRQSGGPEKESRSKREPLHDPRQAVA